MAIVAVHKTKPPLAGCLIDGHGEALLKLLGVMKILEQQIINRRNDAEAESTDLPEDVMKLVHSLLSGSKDHVAKD